MLEALAGAILIQGMLAQGPGCLHASDEPEANRAGLNRTVKIVFFLLLGWILLIGAYCIYELYLSPADATYTTTRMQQNIQEDEKPVERLA